MKGSGVRVPASALRKSRKSDLFLCSWRLRSWDVSRICPGIVVALPAVEHRAIPWRADRRDRRRLVRPPGTARSRCGESFRGKGAARGSTTRLLHRRAEAVVRQPRPDNRGRAKPDSSALATTNKRPRSSRTRTTGRPRRRAGCAPSPLSATPLAGPVRHEAKDQLMARYGLTAAMLRQGPQVRGAHRVVRFEP